MTVKRVFGYLLDWRGHPAGHDVVVAPIPRELAGMTWVCTGAHVSRVAAVYFVRLPGEALRSGGLCQACLNEGVRGTSHTGDAPNAHPSVQTLKVFFDGVEVGTIDAESPDVTNLLP